MRSTLAMDADLVLVWDVGSMMLSVFVVEMIDRHVRLVYVVELDKLLPVGGLVHALDVSDASVGVVVSFDFVGSSLVDQAVRRNHASQNHRLAVGVCGRDMDMLDSLLVGKSEILTSIYFRRKMLHIFKGTYLLGRQILGYHL